MKAKIGRQEKVLKPQIQYEFLNDSGEWTS